ncbi:unnamed protein product [Didymodactylos carnosus]|uniref:Uncharacterized protein n=1 Tax=Didymodactylos carnosus TaxID=1234261 RepID=A0A814NES1_9BILA|nr:unnamed protein product [Didymodactylos carnosus]CAF1091176.1 unnamed protein product [Didymodactylos carnosus]CAF3835775.1 unnamed protein product [Didymodactylos carnosus]CAF3856623.1 unnamed protein product [Didymodactylos carnosus]
MEQWLRYMSTVLVQSSPSSTGVPRDGHWVEELFPATYTIGDYRSTFKPARLDRYMNTLSSLDGPTLEKIYEQSYLFHMIERLVRQDQLDQQTRTKQSQTDTDHEHILDIRLIRKFLEKHVNSKEERKGIDEEQTDDQLWSSDDLNTIRQAYMGYKEECLKLQVENTYYKNLTETLQEKLKTCEQKTDALLIEHSELKKVHQRWQIRTYSAEQENESSVKELSDIRQHLDELIQQNDHYRREHIQHEKLLLEKQTKLEQIEMKIEHYDKRLRKEYEHKLEMLEKKLNVQNEKHQLIHHDLETKYSQEQNLRKQNLLALDLLRKHVASSSSQLNQHQQHEYDIKHVRFVKE